MSRINTESETAVRSGANELISSSYRGELVSLLNDSYQVTLSFAGGVLQ